MGNSEFYSVELETPLGSIRGQVSIDTGPMRLAELVPTACELTDILVNRAGRREEQAGRKISCGPSCGACCRQMVPLSAPEALYLLDFIDSLDSRQRQLLLDRFNSIVMRLRHHQMIDQLLDPDYTDDPVLAIARQYLKLQIPCPFLDNESCSIHPYRPVACREYNVTSPAAWCADPYVHDIAKVQMVLPLSAPLARLTAALTDSKPLLIPLTLMPLWVADHADLRRGQWPGLELFQRFLAEVGKPSSPVLTRTPLNK